MFYRVPRWMGSRGSLTAIGGVREEGYTSSLGVSRPFYQLAARWSAGVRAGAGRSLTRLYAGGAVVERYETDRFDATAHLAGSWGGRIKVRPGIQTTVSGRAFTPDAGFSYAPAVRRRVTTLATLTVWRLNPDSGVRPIVWRRGDSTRAAYLDGNRPICVRLGEVQRPTQRGRAVATGWICGGGGTLADSEPTRVCL